MRSPILLTIRGTDQCNFVILCGEIKTEKKYFAYEYSTYEAAMEVITQLTKRWLDCPIDRFQDKLAFVELDQTQLSSKTIDEISVMWKMDGAYLRPSLENC